jgi:hypothetical protein
MTNVGSGTSITAPGLASAVVTTWINSSEPRADDDARGIGDAECTPQRGPRVVRRAVRIPVDRDAAMAAATLFRTSGGSECGFSFASSLISPSAFATA